MPDRRDSTKRQGKRRRTRCVRRRHQWAGSTWRRVDIRGGGDWRTVHATHYLASRQALRKIGTPFFRLFCAAFRIGRSAHLLYSRRCISPTPTPAGTFHTCYRTNSVSAAAPSPPPYLPRPDNIRVLHAHALPAAAAPRHEHRPQTIRTTVYLHDDSASTAACTRSATLTRQRRYELATTDQTSCCRYLSQRVAILACTGCVSGVKLLNGWRAFNWKQLATRRVRCILNSSTTT